VPDVDRLSWIYVGVLCALILGMAACVLVAANDNYSEAYGGDTQAVGFILFAVIMLVFFIIGTGFWGYENMGDYFAHNLIFYLLFLGIIAVCILLNIRRRRHREE
jgi:peptidoglycan/LPS O-acetylase OafA/YrhL